MYYRDNCPYCDKAKDLLRNTVVKLFKVGMNTEEEQQTRAELVSRLAQTPEWNYEMTVPQMWAVLNTGEKIYIGGCDNLQVALATEWTAPRRVVIKL